MKSFFIVYFLALVAYGQPIVIAHRGASGHRPEHTLEAYQMAIEMGADFIEPDLVLTKDGVLIARHENEISETTNVAEVFPRRKTTKIIDGKKISGWFTEDFTLAELKSLKARQRVLIRSKKYDNQFLIPTFEEVIILAQKNKVGIYPEIKHPSYFESIKPNQKSIIEELAQVLKKYGYDKKRDKIFVQSFELSALKKLKSKLDVPLILLLGGKSEIAFDTKSSSKQMKYLEYVDSESDFKDLKKILAGLGPHKSYLDDIQFIQWSKKANLKVHPYTFREGDLKKDYFKFFQMGVDGVFSDFPDEALKYRREFLKIKSL